MVLECLERKQDGHRFVSIVKGGAIIATIRWRYDHSGRGRNWRLLGTNIDAKFKTISAAKTAVCRLVDASGVVTVKEN